MPGPRHLGLWAQRILVAWLWRWCSIADCDGIPVAVYDAPQATALRARVAAGLALVQELDPRRYRLVRSRLRGLLVLRVGNDAFVPGAGVCVLRQQTLESYSEAVTAAAIVHEATHARLAATSALCSNKRIESLCIREQIDFCRRLPLERYPNSAAYIRYLEGWIGVWPVRIRFGRRYRALIARHANPPAA